MSPLHPSPISSHTLCNMVPVAPARLQVDAPLCQDWRTEDGLRQPSLSGHVLPVKTPQSLSTIATCPQVRLNARRITLRAGCAQRNVCGCLIAEWPEGAAQLLLLEHMQRQSASLHPSCLTPRACRAQCSACGYPRPAAGFPAGFPAHPETCLRPAAGNIASLRSFQLIYSLPLTCQIFTSQSMQAYQLGTTMQV